MKIALAAIRHKARTPRFSLGALRIGREIEMYFSSSEILCALKRHCACDWEDLGELDRRANELGLFYRSRVVSIFSGKRGVRMIVETDLENEHTAVFLQ
jgi:hypothetical protein